MRQEKTIYNDCFWLRTLSITLQFVRYVFVHAPLELNGATDFQSGNGVLICLYIFRIEISAILGQWPSAIYCYYYGLATLHLPEKNEFGLFHQRYGLICSFLIHSNFKCSVISSWWMFPILSPAPVVRYIMYCVSSSRNKIFDGL